MVCSGGLRALVWLGKEVVFKASALGRLHGSSPSSCFLGPFSSFYFLSRLGIVGYF